MILRESNLSNPKGGTLCRKKSFIKKGGAVQACKRLKGDKYQMRF